MGTKSSEGKVCLSIELPWWTSFADNGRNGLRSNMAKVWSRYDKGKLSHLYQKLPKKIIKFLSQASNSEGPTKKRRKTPSEHFLKIIFYLILHDGSIDWWVRIFFKVCRGGQKKRMLPWKTKILAIDNKIRINLRFRVERRKKGKKTKKDFSFAGWGRFYERQAKKDFDFFWSFYVHWEYERDFSWTFSPNSYPTQAIHCRVVGKHFNLLGEILFFVLLALVWF